MSMISGLYDYFAKNPAVTHGTMFALALVVLIGASSSINTHNCINDPNKSKEECEGNEFGNVLNILILTISIILILYSMYSLYIDLDGKSKFHSASKYVMSKMKKK